MATYKLIQDIEAEDHILGPLTLRQFIYGLGAALMYYICFVVITKHVAILLVLFLPIALFATFFAYPFGRDQPTEVWALAKFRFLFKPKKRIWSQSGVKEMVTISVPRKIERHLTNGLSQEEVRNRLKALAITIDSRGWVVKNMSDVPVTEQPVDDSDRLIGFGSIPKPVPDMTTAAVDMFDETGPQTQHMNAIINESTQERMQHVAQIMQPAHQNSPVSEPLNEAAISNDLRTRTAISNMSTSNMHSITTEPVYAQPQPETSPPHTYTPPTVQNPTEAPSPPSQAKSTASDPHIDPAVLSYALNNGRDLTVQTIADEANKSNEVVVKLH